MVNGRWHRALLAGTLGVLTIAGAVVVPGVAGAATGLGATAAARGRYFGAAVQPAKLTDPAYTRILDQEFNSVTPENALEWDAVEPARNQFTFTAADRVVDRARAQGAAARGRGLVSPSANQVAWVTVLGTADDARAALRTHITATVGHFRGRIKTWDVVSEALSDNGAVRPSVFANRLGPAYIEEAFRDARAADPGARLCYNDYGIEDRGLAKTQAVYNLVRDFKARGVPIDCVGLESHFISPAAIPSTYGQTVAAFAALGVDVEITELDIGGSGTAQSDGYRRVVSACVAVSRCTGITVWGVRDTDSWRANLTPLLFDAAGARKPAYYGALSAMRICARAC
ncbi:endo-1,4-beta-xylanase [Dactylosporangium aurantiacum]|uniref:Beta-xylanase n=1 Tax=Dactylosporangium aurantiacum TaxID=35754 RepID=A0A9Q9IA50_9ACTN|nr:endo-1,4-beta-xylanase [Dactylosporangium aurantiacum]MDG6107251.1 endo-1,4-beta-xylanase [Dactylosporangium aurantiacum]UWZ51216.1 endo-1,4-beta-xylanase [Dactylosporangium aurantiacum]